MAHALLSPSAAHRWLRCTASVRLESVITDTSSIHAAEGTAAHELAAATLTSVAKQATAFQGRMFGDFEATAEMSEYVQRYVDDAQAIATPASTVLVEEQVNFGHALNVDPSLAFGTADVIVVTHDGELQLHDLKYGRGVQVDADQNEQLMLYALGALPLALMVGDVTRVRLVIHQPRLGHLSEWACTLEDLTAFARIAEAAAAKVVGEAADELNPGEKQCRFCRAKANCTAFADYVAASTELSIPSPPAYATAEQLEMVEMWVRAQRDEIYAALSRGDEVEGWKLVEGRRGARAWIDDKQAEDTMRAMRLKVEEMYQMKVITPPQAEKLLAKDNPRRWKKLQDLITQSEGRPTVAPATDKRPALQLNAHVAEEFEVLEPPLCQETVPLT